MNYYEHHLGDYMRDTAHLSMLEDGAYRRLLDAYYIKELPIPAVLKDAYRLVRAVSKPERDAVQAVLNEFFAETPTGWQHKRCEAEIARFQDKQAKAKRSAEARWSQQRAQSEGNANASAEAMRTHSEGNAHHTPHTTHQSPDTSLKDTHTSSLGDSARVSRAAAVCLAVKGEGIGSVNPGDPRLLALLERGAEVANFVAAVEGAKGKRSPWAYLLGTVEGQLADATQIASQPRTTNTTRRQSAADRRAETIAGLTGQNRERTDHADRSRSNAVDVETRVVPD